MNARETIGVIQAGATGPVAEKFREIIARPEIPLHLEAVAASRKELAGKKLGEISLCARDQQDAPVITLDKAVNTDAPVVFSSLRNETATEYEDRLASGRLLATNAGANRMRPDVALLNTYINAHQLDELYEIERPGHIIANGNCTSIILSVAMAPIHKAIGIKELRVQTMQGWSGKGLSQVPSEHENEIIFIEGDEQEKIETEPNKFLGSLAQHENIQIIACPKRGPWVVGHHEKIAMRLKRESSAEEIEEAWHSLEIPESLMAASGDFLPDRPIKVCREPLLQYKNGGAPEPALAHPMQVSARVVEMEDPTEITVEIAGDNLVLGAAGASVMNILHTREKGYIR